MTPSSLKRDCERCFALCCVATSFEASADFAFHKAGGARCGYLTDAYRCSLHAGLYASGLRGCAVYECYGAGQRVSQDTFAGTSWQDHPELADDMFAVFMKMRVLHELLMLLAEALRHDFAAPLRDDLVRTSDEVERLSAGSPDEVLEVPTEQVGRDVLALLRKLRELHPSRTLTAPLVQLSRRS